MMGWNIELFLLLTCMRIMITAAETNVQDYDALQSLTGSWSNLPSSWDWNNADPCGSWDGITCSNSLEHTVPGDNGSSCTPPHHSTNFIDSGSRLGLAVATLTLSSLNLKGQLTEELTLISELVTLDLSYNNELTGHLPQNIGKLKQLKNLILVGCGFSGPIPDSIGSLEQLVFLSLNSNNFTGNIPPSIGSLRNLYWLDLSDNQLSGSIPVSKGTTPGLDLLVNAKHFHFGQNQLSGTIPPSLFSSGMSLIHVFFDNNQLTGSIPSTLGLVQTLEAVRFDRNSLTGPVPSNLNNLAQLNSLQLSNNKLMGPMPDLSGMNSLNYVDVSNNTFDASDVPLWFSTLNSLSTLMMERTALRGQIPVTFFSFPQLQTVILKNNELNGTLDIGTNYSSKLQLVDLQNNGISELTPKQEFSFQLILVGNPYCLETGVAGSYCSVSQQSNASYSTQPKNCTPAICTDGQISSPNCKCAYPYAGTLIFQAFYFSVFGSPFNFLFLESSLTQTLQSLTVPVDSVSLSNAAKDVYGYFNILLEIFPAGQVAFNKTGISTLGFLLSKETYKLPHQFGPYAFIANNYAGFAAASAGGSKSSQVGIIIGATVGGIVLILLLLSGFYAYYQKGRADRATQLSHPFANWVEKDDIPQLKGARSFSIEEIKKCTDNFSEANNIGAGGYGKVYKGIIADGKIVAIKRSQAGSMQGSREFKTEIELLSRVHHKNLVKLVGFCCEQGELMLVYEFLPNGTLMDSLSGKSGIRLEWIRRLRAALGSARGLAYLHELADPPIIHRDIKSSNILLDERLNAKVADFGLSMLFGDGEKSYVTTQVKGTLGYLDPEYYMTQQLTEKSDVYSFGVVMLELVTGRRPIQLGKNYIVQDVRAAIDRTRGLDGLHKLIDPSISSDTITLVGFEKFVDLALRCVQETSIERPTMSEVVKAIENMMQLAGVNPNSESAPTSSSYEESSAGNIRRISGADSRFFTAEVTPMHPQR